MAKTLRVIESFFVMDLGDTFEYDEKTNMYVSNHKEEFYKTDARTVSDIKSVYNSVFQISVDYAKTLIADGYLEEIDNTEKSTTFVNVFDEISNLLDRYTNELKDLDKTTSDLPACMKVEKEAVLTNLVTLLEHLKSLKK